MEITARQPVIDREQFTGLGESVGVGVPAEHVAAVSPQRLEGRVAVLEPAVLDRHSRLAGRDQVAVDVEDAIGSVVHRSHARLIARKFLIIVFPCSVRMLSGWNCTPTWGWSRWRTAITTFSSSVVAVSTRQSGIAERSTASE
ncbi:hypothetical protein SY89_01480 [Halolamina pelagica]|uniref:Uncharacterized protein n=1 Tax=Halolamina pelagica TaxID=699431 RepID=A0A0P7HV98_9EURY|nr:hypothetical protein SY89_01480 [Halolamina pelagica]